MCLDTVDKKTTYKRRAIGYKAMCQAPKGTLRGQFFYSEEMKLGSTYTDRKRRPISRLNRGDYPTGYHVFLDKRAAETSSSFSKIVKVRFSDVVASGLQNLYPVVVARTITILKIL